MDGQAAAPAAATQDDTDATPTVPTPGTDPALAALAAQQLAVPTAAVPTAPGAAQGKPAARTDKVEGKSGDAEGHRGSGVPTSSDTDAPHGLAVRTARHELREARFAARAGDDAVPHPATPATPATPAVPATHGEQGSPAVPAMPAVPATPASPTTSVISETTPVAPVAPTAPTTPTAAPAPSVQLDRVTSQVFPEITGMVQRGNGTHRITLTLNPEQLGEVRVVMTMRAGSVHVRLAAGQEARQSLVEGSPELSRLLEHAGAGEARVVVRELPSSLQVAATTAGPTSTPLGAGTDQPMDQHAGTRADHPARDGAENPRQDRNPVPREVRPTQPVIGSRIAGVDLTM